MFGYVLSFEDVFDGPPTATITKRDVTICRAIAQVFHRAGISIAYGTLGNMSLSIFRDTDHAIPILTRFIKDG